MKIIRCQRGVSALEFALILPFLLLITFVIIEFSILLYDKAVLTNASREGTRAGIVFATDASGLYKPKSAAEIKTIVKSYADNLLINLGSTTNGLADSDINFFCKPPISTTWTPGTCNTSGNELKVQVNYTYKFLFVPDFSAMTGGSFNGTLPFQAETVMRME